jgi:hypothetical protein
MFTSISFVLGLFSFSGVIVGLLIYFKLTLAIEIQKEFYEKINWRIEPISMPKEIRNTKTTGAFLVIIAIATMIFFALSNGIKA